MTTRIRFAIWCTLASAVAVLVAGLVALAAIEQATRSVVDSRLDALQARIGRSETVEAACRLAARSTAAGDIAISVLTDGSEQCRSNPTAASPRALGVVDEGAAHTASYDRRVGDRTWRVTVRHRDGLDATVVVSEAIDANLQARTDARRGVYVAMVFGVLLAGVVGALAAGPATRRIDRLVQGIRGAVSSSGAASAGRVGSVGSRDLDVAAAAVDSLLDELRASDEARRRLFADAAHELRTPVTSIRTNAQLLERSDSLDDETRDIARRIARQSAAVGGLVAGLVDHAAAVGWSEASTDEVQLRTIVQAAVEQVRERLPGSIVDVDLDDSRAQVDAELLRRAVGNLLENAFVHGAGPVFVELREGVISVRDSGDGFDPAGAADAFRPFARGPGGHGTGLGLAFVDHVARAHGGGVRIASANPTVVELRLPMPARTP